MAVSEDLPDIEGVAGSLVELWQEFQKMLQNQNLEKQKENRNLAMGFLKCAKDDIAATKLLYENQVFSLSVYHLQQAVEKTTKAYGLILSIISKEELMEIKHKSPLVFIKLLEKSWVTKYIGIIKMLNPEIKTNIDDVEKIINEKQDELAKMPKTVIRSFLTSIQKMKVILQTQIHPWIVISLDLLKPLLCGQTEKLKKSIDEVFRSGVITSFIGLYLLSVITYPHYIFTRYPDGEIKPSDYYSSRLEIVECITDILSEVEACINALEQDYGLKGGHG
ncbi:MAG: HEPN domain-containing protein [Thermoproteota archaeon]